LCQVECAPIGGNRGIVVLRELCEEISPNGWPTGNTDTETWPEDCSFDVFCRWFGYQHHSMLVDLCDDAWSKISNVL